MPAPNECVNACEQVGGREERSPQFILPHVHPFVSARHLQRVPVSRDYHMPERHGVGAACERGQCESPPKKWTMCFDHTLDNRNVPAPQRRQRQHDADQRRRQCPDVSKELNHPLIMQHESRAWRKWDAGLACGHA